MSIDTIVKAASATKAVNVALSVPEVETCFAKYGATTSKLGKATIGQESARAALVIELNNAKCPMLPSWNAKDSTVRQVANLIINGMDKSLRSKIGNRITLKEARTAHFADSELTGDKLKKAKVAFEVKWNEHHGAAYIVRYIIKGAYTALKSALDNPVAPKGEGDKKGAKLTGDKVVYTATQKAFAAFVIAQDELGGLDKPTEKQVDWAMRAQKLIDEVIAGSKEAAKFKRSKVEVKLRFTKAK
tara:strand:+ start:184 stop:918 length:735 start_codon:yes stop_codon:yes gene_type:complete